MQNKRGISTIVGTMMVLLITIVIAGILWYFVNNSFDKSKGELNNDCLNLQLEPIKCEKRILCDYGGGGVGFQANVTVKRNIGTGDLQGVRFVFESVGQKAIAEDIADPNFVELQSKVFSRIPIGGFDPEHVKLSALAGSEKRSCGVMASPVKCTDISTGPISGGPNPGGTPYISDCCQYPWNFTDCTPQPPGSPNPTGGKAYCCSFIPAGYPNAPNSCIPSTGPLSSSICCVDSSCGQYP